MRLRVRIRLGLGLVLGSVSGLKGFMFKTENGLDIP